MDKDKYQHEKKASDKRSEFIKSMTILDYDEIEMDYFVVLFKPDAIRRQSVIHKCMKRFEEAGYLMDGVRWIPKASKKLIEYHYWHNLKKPFYPRLLKSMTCGPIMAIKYYGNITKAREMVGPISIEYGPDIHKTMRGRFSNGLPFNVIHCSVNKTQAKKDLQLWFDDEPIIE